MYRPRVVVAKPVTPKPGSEIFAPTTVRVATGDVVPIPTFPPPSTTKWVAEDDPIANSGTPLPRLLGLMEW